jgi:hypothetical protein
MSYSAVQNPAPATLARIAVVGLGAVTLLVTASFLGSVLSTFI